jgi:thioredoxin reductase/NAD-dependent dihydropyrimidine dehydrogenase PreA subunit
MGSLIYLGFLLALVIPVASHLRRTRRREAAALAAAKRAKLESRGPVGQHPHIDVSRCIGCGACTDVCPEGEVLAVVAGKAAIVHPEKCIGHGLCADACPVGAIEIVMASPSISADLPHLTAEHETNIENLFVIGELGGLALIRNAVNQGRDCADCIARRLARGGHRAGGSDVHDVCVVGAGPGGISASLRAVERKLSCVTLEQQEFGGTVAKYPRQKLVLTSPVEFPMHGTIKKLKISKEELLAFWGRMRREGGLQVRSQERVDDVQKGPDGIFTITTTKGTYRARAVILALGRRGTPRKLGIPGEELPKVMYSLIDAEAYSGAEILVVGGGDSAIEAALGLAYQKGNRVTLSYRRDTFTRIKQRNEQRLNEAKRSGKLKLVLSSQPVEIRDRSVILEVGGQRRELPNDYVWIFAGGTTPNAFLEKVGVRMGVQDLTEEAGREGRLAGAAT